MRRILPEAFDLSGRWLRHRPQTGRCLYPFQHNGVPGPGRQQRRHLPALAERGSGSQRSAACPRGVYESVTQHHPPSHGAGRHGRPGLQQSLDPPTGEKFVGRPIDHFRFSGGGALSDLWSKIHADVLEVPIHQVEDPVNATVRGAAFLALSSLNHIALEDIPERVNIKRVFQPDPNNRPAYDKMYRQYRMLFKKNKKIFKALNES
jgi:hypothetical protein